MPSVKPWIPYFQLIGALEASQYQVILRPSIEPKYFLPSFMHAKQNFFPELQLLAPQQSPDDVNLEEAIMHASLVITGSRHFHDDVVKRVELSRQKAQ